MPSRCRKIGSKPNDRFAKAAKCRLTDRDAVRRNVPLRLLLGVIAFVVGASAVVLFVVSDSAVLKAIGGTVVLVYVLFVAASDWIEAWLNEKHVEAHPHLLKNDAVGETVTASGDFEATEGAATGIVVLNGEKWKAYCPGDQVPKNGNALVVERREGLTLVVRPH